MREVMLILHFIGLVMGLGTSFAHAFLGIATAKMKDDEATKFRLHSMVLSRMGNIGIVLLIISGLYLIAPYWKTLPSTPLLNLKLVLVCMLVVQIFRINLYTRRAKKGETEWYLKKMERLGKTTLLFGLAIVILAVYIFR
jgi:uncharacterized membrane protein